MNRKIMKQEATYDFLKDEVHCLYDEKKELQERIDKAIDKLYLWGETLNPKFQKEMLDILKGSDSNE